MLLPSQRKAYRLPDGDKPLGADVVLRDATQGLRGVSIAVAASAAIFLLILVVGGNFTASLFWSVAGIAVLLSSTSAAISSFFVERNATARLILTVCSILPGSMIGILTIIYFLTGGDIGFIPIAAMGLTAGYIFGLLRLRRPDVQEYFWSLRATGLSSGPGMNESEAQAEEEVVLSGFSSDGKPLPAKTAEEAEQARRQKTPAT